MFQQMINQMADIPDDDEEDEEEEEVPVKKEKSINDNVKKKDNLNKLD